MANVELLNKAKIYIEKEEFNKAEELLKKLLEYKSMNKEKEIYRYLGEIYDKDKKDYNRAIKYYKKVLEYDLTDKEMVEINYTIGELITLSTDYLDPEKEKEEIEELEKEAIPYFKRALDKRFKEYYIEASIQLAVCYFVLDEFNITIEILNKLYDFKMPERKLREVNDLLGACYFGLKKYDKSLIYFKKIDDFIVDNTLVEAKFLLGHIYYFKGKVVEAIKEELEVIYYENYYPNINTQHKSTSYTLIKDTINYWLSGYVKIDLINNITMNIENNTELHAIFGKIGGVFLKHNLIWYALKSYKISLSTFLKDMKRRK